MFQSQTGSQALSDLTRQSCIRAKSRFQSQTGSQALSDSLSLRRLLADNLRFNPKREARPSQTRGRWRAGDRAAQFQSQTGSQALSDLNIQERAGGNLYVSIPNGKPGPLRQPAGRRYQP